MIKFKVKANMSNVLDKVWVESLMPLEYEYLLHVLLKVNIIVSKIVSSRASTGVPLVPGYGTSPYQNDKTNKQNEQSQHPFYLPFGIVFYCKVYHRRFTIVCK